MSIYVQSRGNQQDKDYTWLKVKESTLIREIPPILKRIRVGELIQSEKYSIVLARNDGELVLLVTGLSGERSDFMNRPIRNSIAWVEMDSPETEKMIRSLAVLALTDKERLERQIQEAVVEAEATSEYEFEVNRETINRLSESHDVRDNNNASRENSIGNNYEDLKTEVGLELKENCLPSRDGILVLVTTLKTKSGLEQYNVWRGLSNKVPYQKLTPTGKKKQSPNQAVWILVLVAVVALVLIILLVIKFLNPTQVVPQKNREENLPSQVVPQSNREKNPQSQTNPLLK